MNRAIVQSPSDAGDAGPAPGVVGGELGAPARRTTRRWVWLIALGAIGFAVAAAWWQASLLPKRFGVVEEGRLYRSGEITLAELAKVKQDYGVRTVLSLLNPQAPEAQVQRQAVEQLGLRWINVPLPGNGASTPAQREHMKQVLLDDSLGPMLVHCSAGTNRTGLAVGMYRLHRQGWSLPEVMREMARYGFEDEPHHENLRQALAAEAAMAAEDAAGVAAPG